MSVAYALTSAVLFACGLYMMLSRNLMRTVLGLALVSTAVNLILFLSGRVRSEAPPLMREGETVLSGTADPLPQALVLTAIVIGFALTIVLSALAVRLYRRERTLDSSRIHQAEALGDPFLKGRDDAH